MSRWQRALASGSLRQWLAPGLLLATALVAAPLLWATAQRSDADSGDGAPRAPDVMDAVMNLDEARLATYLRRGWDPNWRLDAEGNDALHLVMMACTLNPTHDEAALDRIARLLVASGADPMSHNAWGAVRASAGDRR